MYLKENVREFVPERENGLAPCRPNSLGNTSFPYLVRRGAPAVPLLRDEPVHGTYLQGNKETLATCMYIYRDHSYHRTHQLCISFFRYFDWHSQPQKLLT